ncbi:MAG: 4-alpha-glucanotransferase [Phycisphaerales bacterium]|nr:4-alpha-glucanotransferase [Phycisphaerales bacterium]
MSQKVNKHFTKRSSGVLLHITSLPSGNLGKGAYKFIDWLEKAGQTWWQMLPVGPTGSGGSPYSAQSSFAGNPSMVCPKTKVDMRGFESWKEDNSWWLDAWCGRSKQKAVTQYKFAKQWKKLRSYAHTKGIKIIGDVPIFVGADSIDVKANPELFRLNRNGNPTVVTGVPPDCFSKDGQRWGHPHYNWKEHKKDTFAWWRNRVRIHLERFDVIRIDHFIGLHHAYEISARAKTARKGVWKRTPGRALLQAMQGEFGELPFIAEDLGHLTKPVEKLRDDFCLPGVRITQQGIWHKNSRDYPSNHPKQSIAYSGTHDTNTAVGALGAEIKDVHQIVVQETLGSPAIVSILLMQDVLGLGSEARMNVPGTIRGNWKWKLQPNQLNTKNATWLRTITEEAKRL